MKLKLEIYLDTVWTELNYNSDNIQIIRKRDNENDLIIRTTCEGDFIFTCPEYDILEPFINTYDDIIARLTETDCDGNIEIYEGFLRLDNEVNFALNQISANFELTDEYYNFFERPEINGETEFDIYNDLFFGLSLLSFIQKYIFMRIFIGSSKFGISLRGLRFGEVIESYIQAIFNPTLDPGGISYNGSDLDNYVMIENEFWNENNDLSYIYETQDGSFNLSFKSILDYLRQQFFYQWYIKDNIFYLIKRKDKTFSQGQDLTTFDNINTQNCRFDDKKITTFEITTKDANELTTNEVYHASAIVNFFKNPNNKLSLTANINTNPLDYAGNGFFLLDTESYTGNFNIAEVNSGWNNEDGKITYMFGNWFSLNFRDFPFDGAIVSNYFQLPTNNIIAVQFVFDYKDIGTYTTGDLELVMYKDPFNPLFDVKFPIADGFNSFSMVGKNFDNIVRIESTIGPSISPTAESTIESFEVLINGSDYVEKVKITDISGTDIPNYYLSNYYILKNNIANMPQSSGKLVMKNIIEETITCHQKTDMYKEMDNIKYRGLISDINFDQEPDTLQGYMRIDQVSKEYKDFNGVVKYNFSKKF